MAYTFVSWLCYVLVYECRFLIVHVKLVLQVGLASLHGLYAYVVSMIWCLFVVSCIASEYAMSLPFIHVCTLTFLDDYVVPKQITCCTLDAIRSLYGWLWVSYVIVDKVCILWLTSCVLASANMIVYIVML